MPHTGLLRDEPDFPGEAAIPKPIHDPAFATGRSENNLEYTDIVYRISILLHAGKNQLQPVEDLHLFR
jgi:hypothetical protein